MKCDQCRYCDSHDEDQNGIYCMIGYPVPEIQEGLCNSFQPECVSDLIRIHGWKKDAAEELYERLLAEVER